MMRRVAVRVRQRGGAWWVVLQGAGVTNASGRQWKRIGPGEEGRMRAEAVAARLRDTFAGRVPHALDDLLVGAALWRWLDEWRYTLKPSTIQSAAGLIRNHLEPWFGARDLRELTERDLLAFANSKLDAGKSLYLVRNALSVLRRVLNLAVREGLVERNPAARLGEIWRKIERRELRETRRVDAWTAAEVGRILQLARDRDRRLYPVLVFLFCTGARRGEALGLRWGDIDFGRSRVHIRRAVVKGGLVTPKSGRERAVALSPDLAAVLREWQASQRRRHPFVDPGCYVFPTLDGESATQETTLHRSWARLRRLFGPLQVRPLTLHSARHTFATLALEAGKSVRWVADTLGHSDPSVTLRVYAHALPEDEADLGFLRFGLVSFSGHQKDTKRPRRPLVAGSKSLH